MQANAGRLRHRNAYKVRDQNHLRGSGGETLIQYLRETSPFHVYSNPTPAEAAAGHTAVDLLDAPAGLALLTRLRAMIARETEIRDG
jgi:hypothetical protein